MAWRGSIPDNDHSDVTFRAKLRLVEAVFIFPTDKAIEASGHNGDHFYTHFSDKHKNHSRTDVKEHLLRNCLKESFVHEP